MVDGDTNNMNKFLIGYTRSLKCSGNFIYDHETAKSTKCPKCTAGNFDFVFSKSSQYGVDNKSWDNGDDRYLMAPVPDKVIVCCSNFFNK